MVISSPLPAETGSSRSKAYAFLVGSGILLSRIAGLIRDRVFAHYLGNSDAADAFRAAFRIPNFLQNLFGEGVLSASFIPVYAGLVSRGRHHEAGRVAGAVAAILSVLVSVLVAVGIAVTPFLISVIAPGFEGPKRELCITLVRILFPGAGLLVFSAWCLGILNSHRRFFLSYAAPVVWNAAIIASLIAFGGGTTQFRLAQWVSWGSVAGSLLQILIQLPTVTGLLRGFRFSLSPGLEGVRTVIRNFVPVFLSRGVVQISAYVDSLLASLLPTGAVAALAYAQTLYTLPASLFGMSVSASELPVLSGVVGSDARVAEQLRQRLSAGLRQIAFFIVPSAMGFLVLGDVIAAAIYQTGRFTRADAIYVWAVLAGATVGLLAGTLGRLYASAFYALQDTRTPMLFAVTRVVLASGVGYFASLHLPRLIGIETRWGVAGITAASGLSAWLEFALLRRSLTKRIGRLGSLLPYTARLWAAAGLAAAFALAVKYRIAGMHPLPAAALILAPYGLTYFAAAWFLKIPEARLVGRFLHPRRRR